MSEIGNLNGKIGEALAQNYLENKGYKILVLNYKTPIGEIDIISRDEKGVLVFIEVKSRLYKTFGLPREMINKQKQKKILLASQCYLKQKKLFGKTLVRFDCIEILGDINGEYEINHLENIF